MADAYDEDEYNYNDLEQTFAPQERTFAPSRPPSALPPEPPPPPGPPVPPKAMPPEPPAPPPLLDFGDPPPVMDPPEPPGPPVAPPMDPPAAPPPPGMTWAFNTPEDSRLPDGGYMLQDVKGEMAFYMPETGQFGGQPIEVPSGTDVQELIAMLHEAEKPDTAVAAPDTFDPHKVSR